MVDDRKWRHVGGGCFLDPKDADDPEYPCDDQYEDSKGNWAYFDTSMEAHLVMPGTGPGEVNATFSLEEIKARPGVKFVKIESIKDARRKRLN